MWLGAWAWRDVTARLRAGGHEVHPLTLTGVADRAHAGGPGTNLDTHVTDVVALIETEELTDVVLAGHSYAGSVITLVADRVPDRLRRVVYVDCGPLPSGTSLLDTFDEQGRAGLRAGLGDGWLVPPRAWDAAADPVLLAGLSARTLAELERRCTGHPFASVDQPLAGTGAGTAVPRTLIASTFPLDQVQAMIAQGHPYFAGLATAEILALPTGHWPMLSEPDGLADLLAGVD
jgi:pimeloyl-ACP methyl ester carboxylesterase